LSRNILGTELVDILYNTHTHKHTHTVFCEM